MGEANIYLEEKSKNDFFYVATIHHLLDGKAKLLTSQIISVVKSVSWNNRLLTTKSRTLKNIANGISLARSPAKIVQIELADRGNPVRDANVIKSYYGMFCHRIKLTFFICLKA